MIMTKITSILPIAGMGTRMAPLSKAVPKELLPLPLYKNGEMILIPIIHLIFKVMFKAGIRDYVFVLSKNKDIIKSYFTIDDEYLDLLRTSGKKLQIEVLDELRKMVDNSRIRYVYQDEPKGFGDAVYLASKQIKTDVIIHPGDDYLLYTENYITRMINAKNEVNADIITFVEEVDDPRHYGVIKGVRISDDIYRVLEIYEKPSKPPSKMAVVAIYYLDNSMLKYVEKAAEKGMWEFTDAISYAIQDGAKVYALKIDHDIRVDVGRPETYLESLFKTRNHLVD